VRAWRHSLSAGFMRLWIGLPSSQLGVAGSWVRRGRCTQYAAAAVPGAFAGVRHSLACAEHFRGAGGGVKAWCRPRVPGKLALEDVGHKPRKHASSRDCRVSRDIDAETMKMPDAVIEDPARNPLPVSGNAKRPLPASRTQHGAERNRDRAYPAGSNDTVGTRRTPSNCENDTVH
jgi:hypothetical protein